MAARLDFVPKQRGFTLVELILVIVILGVIGSMVAVFMKGPIDAYFSGGKRAALTDVADGTMRRIARDIHRALPNSVRVSGSACLEYIPTKTGGRYRTEEIAPGDNTSLNFASTDTTFNMLGSNNALPSTQRIASGDLIVVYNLGVAGASAYDSPASNRTTVSGTPSESGTPAETSIPIASFKFPLRSNSHRFHVVDSTEKMVSYVCSGNTLFRTGSNAISASASCPTSGPVIAKNVDCGNTSFSIADAGNALNRNALVSMKLTIKDSASAEAVTLQHEVHVDNTP